MVCMSVLGKEWAFCLLWMGRGTQQFDPNHWRQWVNSPSRSWVLNIIDKGAWTQLLVKEICRRSSQEIRSRKSLSCTTLEQFSPWIDFRGYFEKSILYFAYSFVGKRFKLVERRNFMSSETVWLQQELFWELIITEFFSFWVCLCKIPPLRELFVKNLYR